MRLGRNLTVGQRTLTCFGLMVALLLGVSLAWRASVEQLGGSLELAVNRTALKLQLAGDLRTEFKAMLAEARGAQFSLIIRLLHAKGAQGREDAVSAGCAACHTPEMQEEGRRRFEDGSERLRAELGRLAGLDPTREEKELLAGIERDVGEWQALYAHYLELAAMDRYDEAHDVMTGKIAPLLGHADASVAELMEAQRAALVAAAGSVDKVRARNRQQAVALVGAGLLLAGFVVVTIRSMTRGLRRVAEDVDGGTAGVAAAARQAASSSVALARGASEQAASLSEASSAGRAVGGEAEGNERRARAAAAAADRSRAGFAEVRSLLEGTLGSMSEAEAASSRMASILRVIDEIASQTNLLALNAAVEAARAGEAGLGFAVVAGEVRTLAGRCAEASGQIASLVEEVLAKNQDTARRLGVFDGVVSRLEEETSELSRRLGEVTAGSRQQRVQLEHLGAALRDMDAATQSNAGVAEESAASAEHLEAQAATLRDAAAVLTRMVGSDGTR